MMETTHQNNITMELSASNLIPTHIFNTNKYNYFQTKK